MQPYLASAEAVCVAGCRRTDSRRAEQARPAAAASLSGRHEPAISAKLGFRPYALSWAAGRTLTFKQSFEAPR